MRSASFSSRLLCGASAFAALLAFPAGVSAQTRPTDPSTLDILDVLVEKGVLTRPDADAVLAEARKRSEADAGVVRVPYVPEAVRAQIREEVRQDVVATAKSEGWAQPGSLPGWLDRFTFSGDVRVRAEGQSFQKTNTPLVYDVNAVNADGGFTTLDVLPFLNTIDDRYRGRIRARFAVDAKVNNFVDAGIRFATGNLSDPTSTNETMTGNFDRFTVGLDRAYIRLRPFGRDERFGNSGVILGKFENPFMSTDMVFDRDLQFDGVAATVDAALGEGENAPHVFLTAGAFPLEEWSFTSQDKFLFAGQIGASASPVAGVRLKAAGALYQYSNVQGQYNSIGMRDNDFTAPQRVQFGNSVFNLRQDDSALNTVLFGLASKFRVAVVSGRAEFDINPTLVGTIDLEGAKNLAFDRDDLDARSVLGSSGDTAWHALASVGHRDLDVQNAWQLSAGYRRMEADSMLDLFTDSDFGLGGTDQKGFVVQANWAPAANMLVTGAWHSARTIDLIDVNGLEAPPIDVDTFQLDLAVKF